MSRHLAVTLSAAVLMSGCMNDSSLNVRADTAGAPASGDTGSETDATTADSATPPADPEWYRLDATLTLEEGLLLGSAVTLEFLDRDLHVLTDCGETRETLGVVASVETPDPSIFHWWQIALGDSAAACDGTDTLPSELFLGLGQLHPEVEAQLLSLGLDQVAGSLYGAYVMLDPDQAQLDAQDQLALAYGYAGTLEDLAGETTARSAAPLPDGDYAVSGVYLLPLGATD